MLRFAIASIVISTVLGCGTSSSTHHSAAQLDLQDEPDITKSKPLDRWPDREDLQRLKSVEGKSKREVIRALGHPCKVSRQPDGTEIWDYPWLAACRVWIKDGKCSGTFYTAGY
jgi:hypothetical protein